ncbi:MAG: hypothetical protein J0I20_32410 [Chloroflexi bacterium]|nr:hypothetical protein [Chloroflexota bacterium]OJV91974.1 MAG: hypothetical protein BGO39_12765 [Chloroflexi bacterium 54-19]
MSRSINGYIELNTGAEQWLALIDLSLFIDLSTNDQDTYTVLFGDQPHLNWRKLGFQPLFEKSTFPDNVSKEVGLETGIYDENTYQRGQIINGYYYPYFSDGYVIGWSEIKAINWRETNLEGETRGEFLTGNWQTIFDLMEVLAKNRKAKNIRLVVWMT